MKTGGRCGARVATILVAAASLSVAACGGNDKASEKPGVTNPASQIAPHSSRNGAVATRVPVYDGDPKATRKPAGEAVLASLPRVVRPEQRSVTPRIRGSAGQTVAQWLNTIDNDVATFWQGMFNRSGLAYAPATQSIFSAPLSTPCGPANSTTGPFYCGSDTTIFLPLPWFVREANPVGDTAIAVVVAHENGHRVQDLLGILRDRRRRGIDTELQADCLAGLWAASVYSRGLLEPGDLDEAWSFTRAGGDAPGTPASDPGAHGRPAQRLRSFQRGYNSGLPAACRI